jgi:hypothetical protein
MVFLRTGVGFAGPMTRRVRATGNSGRCRILGGAHGPGHLVRKCLEELDVAGLNDRVHGAHEAVTDGSGLVLLS